MRYDSGQFGAFDGLDNRKTVMALFVRMGQGKPEVLARSMRAGFLQALIDGSMNGFAKVPRKVSPCSAVEAYNLFVAITGVLGVPIDRAARLLEETVRRQS